METVKEAAKSWVLDLKKSKINEKEANNPFQKQKCTVDEFIDYYQPAKADWDDVNQAFIAGVEWAKEQKKSKK